MSTSKLSLFLVLLILIAGCVGKVEEQATTQTSSTEIVKSTTPTSTPIASTTSTTDETTTPETTTTTTAPVPDNPWEKEELVVQVENQMNPRNFKPLVREALDYWEENDSQYGDYEVNYTVTTDHQDPDKARSTERHQFPSGWPRP